MFDSGGDADDMEDMFGSLFSLFSSGDFSEMFGGSTITPAQVTTAPPAQQSGDASATPAASSAASTASSSASSSKSSGSGYTSTEDSMAALFSSLFENLGSAFGMAPKGSTTAAVPASTASEATTPSSVAILSSNLAATAPSSATSRSIPVAVPAPAADLAASSIAPSATAVAAAPSTPAVSTNNGDDISNLFTALFNSFSDVLRSAKAADPPQGGPSTSQTPAASAGGTSGSGSRVAAPAGHAVPAFATSMFGMLDEPDDNLVEMSDLGQLLPGLLGPAATKSIDSITGSSGTGSSSSSSKPIPEFAKQMLIVLGGHDVGLKGLDLGSLMGLNSPGSGSPLAGIMQLAGPMLGSTGLGGLLGGLGGGGTGTMDAATRAVVEAQAQQSQTVLSRLQDQLDAWDTLFEFPQYDNLLSASGFNITELLEEDHPLLAKLWEVEAAMEGRFCTPSYIIPAQEIPTSCSAGSLTLLAKGGECRLLRGGKVACSKPQVTLVHVPPSCAYAHKTSEVILSKECKLSRQFGNTTTGFVNQRPPSTTYFNLTQGWDSVPGFLHEAREDAQATFSSFKERFSSHGSSSSGSTLWERFRQREPLLRGHQTDAPAEEGHRQGLLGRLHERLQQRHASKFPPPSPPPSLDEGRSVGESGAAPKTEGGHKGLFGKLRDRVQGEVDSIRMALAARWQHNEP